MTRILLVTGARVLADRLDVDDVRAWVEREVERAAREHNVTMVLCGDARGPDAWAREWALSKVSAARGIRCAVYVAQSGAIDLWHGRNLVSSGKWHACAEKLPPERRPLYRNAAMIDHAASRDPSAVVLGFIDASPARMTRGTEHTLSCARDRRLRVFSNVWGFTS